MELQDSGNRREFDSGAVRDINEGKGRCDLLPLGVVADMIDDEILYRIDQYVRSGNRSSLVAAIKSFAEYRYGGLYTALLEVSKHYEDEPHDRAFLWNMLGALWTQQYHPECCDLPFTEEVQND